MHYFILTLVMFSWGLNVVAVKFLVEHFPPLAMQGYRVLLAGLLSILILACIGQLRKLSKREWIFTILAAILGQLGHHAFLAVGLLETNASSAALILGLSPLTTSILAIIFLHDRLTWFRTIGIGLAFTGVAIVVSQNSTGIQMISRGDFYIFSSMFLQACSFILIKKVSTTLSPKQMTTYMLLIGAVCLLGISFFIEPQGTSNMAGGTMLIWGIFLVSAIFATGVGHILYNLAIERIGAGETAIFNNLIPFFAIVGAFIFLGEPVLLSQVIGFLLIMSGVLLGSGYIDSKWENHKKPKLQSHTEN
jgi:drug/metabolite transporter (DMT)-like permease